MKKKRKTINTTNEMSTFVKHHRVSNNFAIESESTNM